MIRARFELTGNADYRPVEWPIKHPYWCTGYGAEDGPIIVAYADDLDEIERLWPNAIRPIDSEPASNYVFSDRFPRPYWFTEDAQIAEADEDERLLGYDQYSTTGSMEGK